MAASAIRTELAIMNVVGSMATAAIAVHDAHLRQRVAVAVVAGDVSVRALERECGLRVVIEEPDVPRDRIVAILAAFGEVAPVRIGFPVAGNAIGLCVRECLRGMAVFAFRFGMRAKQREIRQVMVEEHRVLPVDVGVAAFAGGAERPLVGVVFRVTGVTARLQGHLEDWFDMAGIAGDFYVGTCDAVIGVSVVVKSRIRPRRTDMAGIALLAVVSVVAVVFEVA